MSQFVRRIVSGNKARFKDEQLDLELDLVYITDHVIVMGYPAAGIEGLYRNNREDAKKFLDTRHGKNYWVFNFCPIIENTYPVSVFDGRVSRYPFPDHHAPPLAILPLVAREMRLWLDGSPERTVALHCKAGKGRSGTMACSYLMSLDDSPSPPRNEKNYTAKEWAKVRAEEWMQTVPSDDPITDVPAPSSPALGESRTFTEEAESGGGATGLKRTVSKSRSPSDTLSHVLELHTARRMKKPSSPSEKVKQGVSIPSQRRWLYYWSLLLSHVGPSNFWTDQPHPKVRITSITVRMKDLSPVKSRLVKAANALLDRTYVAKTSHGQVWVSLARYDDKLVSSLETWEQHTRDEEGHLGKRKPGTSHKEEEALSNFFASGQWDHSKMVRSFARLGITSDGAAVESKDEAFGKITTYTLQPLNDEKWGNLQKIINDADDAAGDGVVASETASINDVAVQTLKEELGGVLVDASREVRAKLYIGQVFMGWFWFIPAFHMSSEQTTRFRLSRKEVDFPLGLGKGLLDVEVCMEPCDEPYVEPLCRVNSAESREGNGEPVGAASNALEAIAAGNIGEAVESKQAAED